jgi:hypothetical protein
MAYSRKRIIIFGAAGIAIAAFLILAFIPVQKETRINPIVALQEIPGYGFQLVRIGEEQIELVHLNITLDTFEVRNANGTWVEIEIPEGKISFDIHRVRQLLITADVADLKAGSYNAIRFSVVQGSEYTNATLDNGDVIGVDVPTIKVEFMTSTFEVAKSVESLRLKLQTGSGFLSNYITPQLHITIGSLKFEIEVITV